MEADFASILASIITDLGSAITNPARVRDALQKADGNANREIEVIVRVIEAGLFLTLSQLASTMNSGTAREVVEALMTRQRFTQREAEWAVRVWVKALRRSASLPEMHPIDTLASVKEDIRQKRYIVALTTLSEPVGMQPTAETFMLRGAAACGLLLLTPSLKCLLQLIHLPARTIPRISSVLENPTFALLRALELYRHIIQTYPGAHAANFLEVVNRFSDEPLVTLTSLSQLVRNNRREANQYSKKLLQFLESSAEQADTDFSRVHALRPEFQDAYYYHGIGLHLADELDSAILRLQRNEVVHYDIGEWDYRTAKDDAAPRRRAINYFTHALQLDPSLHQALYYRAISLEYYGEYERALADVNQLLTIDNNHSEAHLLRGILRQSHFQYKTEDVIEDFSEAVRSNPYLSAAYAQRGSTYRKNGDLKQAESDLLEAIRLDPLGVCIVSPLGDSTLYYHWLGNCYWEYGLRAKALEVFSDAISINLDDENAFFSRGECFYELGEIELALADYRMVKALQDDSALTAFTYLALGECYYALLRRAEALWSYQRFIELHEIENKNPYQYVPVATRNRMQEIFTYFGK